MAESTIFKTLVDQIKKQDAKLQETLEVFQSIQQQIRGELDIVVTN